MLRLVFMLALVAALAASIILMVRRPVKLLAKIQVALTVLVVIAFIVGMKMSAWLHSMSYDDPLRQKWQPRFDFIGAILWFGTIVPWLLFTIYHVATIARKRMPAA